MADRESELDLFERFIPRYEVISLVPIGWGNISFGTENAQRFYLQIQRGGREITGYTSSSAPHISFRKSGLSLSGFEYDQSREETIHEQLKQHISQLISTNLLAGRVFRLKPSEPFTELGVMQERYFKIEVEGEPIPGFHLEQNCMRGGWTCFLPRDTPEWNAIVSLGELERARKLEAVDATGARTMAEAQFESAMATAA